MKVAHIFLLCILEAALLSTVLCNNASGPNDCCFGFFQKPMNKKFITSYYKTDPRCPKRAVVLITRTFRRICVNPKQLWVERIINYLENKSF